MERVECPIKACNVKARTVDSIGRHLYICHRKSEIIEALLTALGYRS